MGLDKSSDLQANVSSMLSSLAAGRTVRGALRVGIALSGVAWGLGCGEEGLLPTTVDPGANFAVADVLFDEAYFYCEVEPVIFAHSCGAGDPSRGDATGGCHANVTSYRLTDYAPLVAEGCEGVVPAPGSITEPARQNYRASQARMRLDTTVAPLLTRPTGRAAHPRTIFEEDSEAAAVIRQWASQVADQ